MSKSSSKHEYKVKDLVIDDEYDIISPDATIVDAAKKMKEKNLPDLVVIDQNTNLPLGVITDFDIINKVVAENIDSSKILVKQVMYTIKPVDLNTPVKLAFTRMRELNVNVVPVVDNNKFLGVATIQDCWSFIPDREIDNVGFIPVSDPKYAEFWLASISALLAFILGVLLPIAGVFGYFTGSASDLAGFFHKVEIRGGPVTFFLFDARGSEFYESFLDLVKTNGVIWAFIIMNGILLIIFGAIGLFSIFYNGFADLKGIRVNYIVQKLLPILYIVFAILEWILLGIGTLGVEITINPLGITFSIISILLVLLGMAKEYIFRQAKAPNGLEVKQ